MIEHPDVVVRPAREGDLPLIFDSWLKTARTSDPCRAIPGGVFQPMHHRLVERLLSYSTVLVACQPGDEDEVFGWICCETPGVLHCVYVKHMFQGYGIGARLVAEAQLAGPLQCSHFTKALRRWATRTGLECDYNPYLLYEV